MITKNTFAVMFFIRKHRGKDGKVPRGKEGKAPIYARITVDGMCTELSVKLNVDI